MLYRPNVTNVNFGTAPSITGRSLAHARRTASQRAAVAAALHLGELSLMHPTEVQCAALCKVSAPWLRHAARLDPDLRQRVIAGEIPLTEALAQPTAEALMAAIKHFGCERAFDLLTELLDERQAA
jgi:hypothetical protein